MSSTRMLSAGVRVRGASSSDGLRGQEPGILGTLRDGLRRAPSGALFVVGVCLVISVVALIARVS